MSARKSKTTLVLSVVALAAATMTLGTLLSGCASLSTKANNEQAKANAAAPEVVAPAIPSPIPGTLDLELTKYTYPWPVRQYHFESQKQSLQMSYMDLRPTNTNGHTVVLLHGKNFGSNYWEPIAEAMAQEGFRVIMIDQIGFGKSSKPESYQFTFHALAINTHELLKSLGIKNYAVVGHSMGGMLAIRFALMFPGAVEKLVLINPLGLEDWRLTVPYHSVEENYHQELYASPDSIRDDMRANYFAGEWRPEYDRLTEIAVGWMKSPDYNQIAWEAALTSDMIFTQPVLYELSKIVTSTLLVIGIKDRTAIGKKWVSEAAAQKLGDYVALGRKAQRLIPRAQLVEVGNAGHLPQVQNFVKVRDAMTNFLKPASAL